MHVCRCVARQIGLASAVSFTLNRARRGPSVRCAPVYGCASTHASARQYLCVPVLFGLLIIIVAGKSVSTHRSQPVAQPTTSGMCVWRLFCLRFDCSRIFVYFYANKRIHTHTHADPIKSHAYSLDSEHTAVDARTQALYSFHSTVSPFISIDVRYACVFSSNASSAVSVCLCLIYMNLVACLFCRFLFIAVFLALVGDLVSLRLCLRLALQCAREALRLDGIGFPGMPQRCPEDAPE